MLAHGPAPQSAAEKAQHLCYKIQQRKWVGLFTDEKPPKQNKETKPPQTQPERKKKKACNKVLRKSQTLIKKRQNQTDSHSKHLQSKAVKVFEKNPAQNFDDGWVTFWDYTKASARRANSDRADHLLFLQSFINTNARSSETLLFHRWAASKLCIPPAPFLAHTLHLSRGKQAISDPSRPRAALAAVPAGAAPAGRASAPRARRFPAHTRSCAGTQPRARSDPRGASAPPGAFPARSDPRAVPLPLHNAPRPRPRSGPARRPRRPHLPGLTCGAAGASPRRLLQAPGAGGGRWGSPGKGRAAGHGGATWEALKRATTRPPVPPPALTHLATPPAALSCSVVARRRRRRAAGREGGGKGGRRPDGRRNALLPAAPGAHRPFNGAGPGGEGAPPLPCQVVSPGGGAAAGGGGGAARTTCGPRGGSGRAGARGRGGAGGGGAGGGGALPRMGRPWGLTLRDTLKVISQKFWSSC